MVDHPSGFDFLAGLRSRRSSRLVCARPALFSARMPAPPDRRAVVRCDSAAHATSGRVSTSACSSLEKERGKWNLRIHGGRRAIRLTQGYRNPRWWRPPRPRPRSRPNRRRIRRTKAQVLQATAAGRDVCPSSRSDAADVIRVLQSSLRQATLRAEEAERHHTPTAAQGLQSHSKGYTASQYGSPYERHQAKLWRRQRRRNLVAQLRYQSSPVCSSATADCSSSARAAPTAATAVVALPVQPPPAPTPARTQHTPEPQQQRNVSPGLPPPPPVQTSHGQPLWPIWTSLQLTVALVIWECFNVWVLIGCILIYTALPSQIVRAIRSSALTASTPPARVVTSTPSQPLRPIWISLNMDEDTAVTFVECAILVLLLIVALVIWELFSAWVMIGCILIFAHVVSSWR